MLSRPENTRHSTNLNSLKNAAYQTPAATINNEAQKNQINFRGNDDFGISKAYASAQIDDSKQADCELRAKRLVEAQDVAVPLNASNQAAATIWNEIENSKTIAILTHTIPDGDAVGSGLTLLNALKENFPDKTVEFITPGNIPKFLKEMPGADSIITDKSKCSAEKYDLAIALDCDETMMNGLDIYKFAAKRINIDHHGTNRNLNNGEDNKILLVDAEAPSTTEVIYNKLLKPMNIPLSPAAAECVLTGILTDTGEFKYARNPYKAKGTSEELLKIMNKNGKNTVDSVMKKLRANAKESEELRALGEYVFKSNMVKSIKTKDGKDINYLLVDQETLKKLNVKDNNIEIKQKLSKIGERLRQNAEMSVVMWQTGDEEIRVSMKSKQIIVNDLAAAHGGGGHQHSAGMPLIGEKDKVVNDFIAELKEYEFKES